MRGDNVGWFKGDPCHDGTTGRLEETSKCWPGTHMHRFQSRIDSLAQLLGTQITELQVFLCQANAVIKALTGNGVPLRSNGDVLPR